MNLLIWLDKSCYCLLKIFTALLSLSSVSPIPYLIVSIFSKKAVGPSVVNQPIQLPKADASISRWQKPLTPRDIHISTPYDLSETRAERSSGDS